MTRMLPAILTAACLTLLHTNAIADGATTGIGQQNRLLFQSMTNATSPSAHMGIRRGSVDGGSFESRNRVMNESVWQIVPPSFEAGCGGIDLFAGSFSFISGEQFQQLLRSIAANAAGYAFQVALENITPGPARIIADLQRKIQALNQGYLSSCQLAKGLVNETADAFNLKHQDKTSLKSMAKDFGDMFETRTTTAGRNPTQQVEQAVPDQEERIDAGIEGNLVWEALKESNVTSWFPSGDAHLMETIMSVTGSVIIGPSQTAPDGEGKSPTIKHLPGGLVSIRDILWGQDRYEAAASAGHKIRKYDCGGTGGGFGAFHNRCLDPQARDHTAPIGLVQLTRNILTGDPKTAGSLGLVQKMAIGTHALSSEEMALLENIPGDVGVALSTLSRHGHGLAVSFAHNAAPVIAFEMAQVLMNDLVRAAEMSLAAHDNTYTKLVLEQIARTRQQISADYASFSSRYGNYHTLIARYRDMLAVLKDDMPVTLDVLF